MGQIDKEFAKHRERAQKVIEAKKNEKRKDVAAMLSDKAKEEINKAESWKKKRA